MLGEVAQAVQRVVPERHLAALVLLGGYGRGEGGVHLDALGVERCNNNFDFLVVTRGFGRPARVEADCRKAVAPLVDRYELGFDVSAIAAARLRGAAPRVVWYDMQHGHRTLAGDPAFVPALPRLEPRHIPSWDVRDLLVNRGTLLLINQMLLTDPGFEPAWRPVVIRHAIKAIIGYGDALLYFLGDYHWSYQEKRARMAKRRDVPRSFRELYDEAVGFRFQPNYERFDGVDLARWCCELVEQLRPIHLACEASRLRVADLSWDRYLDAALAHAMADEPLSVRAWAGKLKRGMGSLVRRELWAGGPDEGAGTAHRTARALCSSRELLSVIYPFLVYDLPLPDERAFARDLLEAADTSTEGLRQAFLARWGRSGDVNYAVLLGRLGVAQAPVREQVA
jgi:hypothetical protein